MHHLACFSVITYNFEYKVKHVYMKGKLLSIIASCLTGLLMAQEPASNPTNMQFSNITSYSMSLNFTGNGSAGYMVVRTEQPISADPVDGTTYEKGEGFGGGKVISFGTSTGMNVRNVLEGTKYYYTVYAYNGTGANINYRQTNPLVDSATALAADPGNYYNSINNMSSSFIGDLTALIHAHNVVAYSQFRNNIIPAIHERDTVNAQTVVNCEYSGFTTVYNAPFDFTALQYNREHALPKSWMLTGGNTSNPDGADYHNLLLTRDIPNNYRSNHPLGNVVSTTSAFGLAKLGRDANNQIVFEPQASKKGDDARAMFYQMVCYNGQSGTWGFDYLLTEANLQDQALLKQWALQDPPDKFERTKNEYIFALQQNRNPFIDHPEWIDCINFDSLVKTNLCGAVGLPHNEALEIGLKLYPNPANNVLNIEIQSDFNTAAQLEVYDYMGRMLDSQVIDINMGYNIVTKQVSYLQNGNYLLKISNNGKWTYQKFVIVN